MSTLVYFHVFFSRSRQNFDLLLIFIVRHSVENFNLFGTLFSSSLFASNCSLIIMFKFPKNGTNGITLLFKLNAIIISYLIKENKSFWYCNYTCIIISGTLKVLSIIVIDRSISRFKQKV